MLWPTQRKDRRYHIAVPVRIRGVDRDGNAFDREAWTLDVSAMGACIHVPEDLDLPRVVRITSDDYQFRADADVTILWERREPQRRVGVTLRAEAPCEAWQGR